MPEEVGGHLVVLLVREVRHRRQHGGIHPRHEGLEGRRRALAMSGVDLAQALFAESADPGAHDGVRNEALFHPVDRAAGGLNHGVNSPGR